MFFLSRSRQILFLPVSFSCAYTTNEITVKPKTPAAMQQLIQQGEVPGLGDVQRMVIMSCKVYAVLERNGAINR